VNVDAGGLIRQERLRRQLSLRELARQVGVSASMPSQVETGRARPSVTTIYAIAAQLGLSIDALLSGDETAVAGLRDLVRARQAAGARGAPAACDRGRRRQGAPPPAQPGLTFLALHPGAYRALPKRSRRRLLCHAEPRVSVT
jgi:transcriptional regulator with XRE-family HTH domain